MTRITLFRENPAAPYPHPLHLCRKRKKKKKIHKSLLNKAHCSGLRASLTDPEALAGERVRRLAVLGDQRGVVALLAGILAVALQADPLADEGSDDHFEALPGRGALHAARQPVDAQPDDKQTGDQRGHPGILRGPPQRPGRINSQAPAPESAACLNPGSVFKHGGRGGEEKSASSPECGGKSLPSVCALIRLGKRYFSHVFPPQKRSSYFL